MNAHSPRILSSTISLVPLDRALARPFRERRESLLAEWLPPWNHEDDILGHQAEHGVEIAAPARRHPGLYDLPDRPFVIAHVVLPPRLHPVGIPRPLTDRLKLELTSLA